MPIFGSESVQGRKKRRSLQKGKQRRGPGLSLQHQLTPHSPTPGLCGIEGQHLRNPGLPRRPHAARQTPLGDTGKPKEARKVRTVSFVHLEALTGSSPPLPGHLISPGALGKDAKPDSWEDGVTCHSSSTRLRLEPAQVSHSSLGSPDAAPRTNPEQLRKPADSRTDTTRRNTLARPHFR